MPSFNVCRAAVVIVAVCCAVLGADIPGAQWTQASAGAPWNARGFLSLTLFKNRLYLMGGKTISASLLNDVWTSADGISWTLTQASADWSGRSGHSSVSLGRMAYVIGGNDGAVMSDVWSSRNMSKWKRVTNKAPWTERWRHGSVVFSNVMWVVGGDNDAGTAFNDVWSSANGSAWTCVTRSAPWVARGRLSLQVFQNRLWIVGGADAGGNGLNDVWSSADGTNWVRATAGAPWMARHSHTCVPFDNKLWVLGGMTAAGPTNDAWSSLDGATWVEATNGAPWAARGGHASVAFANAMWVMAGGNGAAMFSNVWFSTRAVVTNYVNHANTAAVYPYLTWATAASNIQQAVDAAGDYDVVLVATGVYSRGGDVVPLLALSNRVAITRPMTVVSVGGPGLTVIQGMLSPPMRCAYVVDGAVLSGFALEGGGTMTGEVAGTAHGGGVLLDGGIVTNCVIRGSRATYGGGAFLNGGGELAGCIVSNNSAVRAGGAMTWLGGEIRRSVLIGNTASQIVGGVHVDTDSLLEWSSVASNTCPDGAGGVYVVDTGTARYSMVVGNSGYLGGGAVSMATGALHECGINGNNAYMGGGVYSDSEVAGCTVVGNQAVWRGGGVYLAGGSARDSIIYNNAAPDGQNYFVAGGGAPFSFCCLWPAPSGGVSNRIEDPLVVGIGNAHISPYSPCVDAAGAGSLAGARDIDNEPRIVGARRDIGCDEVMPAGIVSSLSARIMAEYTNAVAGMPLTFVSDVRGKATYTEWRVDGAAGASDATSIQRTWATPGVYRVILRAFNSTYVMGVADTVSVSIVSAYTNYVSLTGTPAAPFTSWSTAARAIQDAVAVMDVCGGIVMVSNGVYASGGATASGMSNRLAVAKQIVIRSLNGAGVTAISGAGPTGGAAVRCAYVARGALLDGFMLSNGFTLATAANGDSLCGAGAFVDDGGIVSNCIVTRCTAARYGGGVFCRSGSTVVDSCATLNAAWGGGGIWCDSAGRAVRCAMTANSAGTGGGAGAVAGGVIDRCTVQSNTATTVGPSAGIGGGVYGLHAYRICNSLVSHNNAQSQGGGIYCGADVVSATGYVDNCTVAANSAGTDGGVFCAGTPGVMVQVDNTIMYLNTGGNWNDGGGAPFLYCCSSPRPTGVNNLNADPLFVAASAGNFRLTNISPCINTGTNMIWMQTTRDLDGSARIINSVVDRGCYEYRNGPALWVTPTFIDFGSLDVGTVGTASFSVLNDGGGVLTTIVSGVRAPFSLADPDSYILGGGSGVTIRVVYSAQMGIATNTLMLSGGGGAMVDLHGRGTATNVPPLMPGNLSPADGGMDQPLSLSLSATAFFDPDVGDTHAASQWQVATNAAIAPVVHDSGILTSNLTLYPLPISLMPLTRYYWHVRYRESGGLWSEWSDVTWFETMSIAPFIDITNADATVRYPIDTCAIAGSNNANVVGGIRWTNTLNGAWGSVPVTGDRFLVTGIPLAVGTNAIVVTATNSAAMTAADTATVVRLEAQPGELAPFVDVTNTGHSVAYETTVCSVGGTNNIHVAGMIWWSNSLNGAMGSLPVAATSFQVSGVPIGVGSNTVVVRGSNLLDAVTGDSVTIVRLAAGTGQPFIDVTNPLATVTFDETTWTVAGTNNVHVVGGMRWTNALNGAMGALPVTGDWFQVSGVPIGVGSNVVLVSGTNAYGVSTGDVAVVVRGPAGTGTPFVDITNAPAVIAFAATNCLVFGTNNLQVAGSLRWTNHTSGAAGPVLRDYSGGSNGWACDAVTGIAVGANYITVHATNMLGLVAYDGCTVVRLSTATNPPLIVITNGARVDVTFDSTSVVIGGTNHAVVGTMSWSNRTGVTGGVLPASNSWSIVVSGLVVGINEVYVCGTNDLGDIASGFIGIARGGIGTGTPHVDITNAPATVNNDVATYAVAGTNNMHVVGIMWATNASMAVARVEFPAAAGWTTPQLPLVVGVNSIAVYGTNELGAIASDTVVVTRGPEGTGMPFIDLTNGVMLCDFAQPFFSAGTNNAQVMGMMWISNASMGGASASFTATPSWVSAPISLMPSVMQTNMIYVYGSNLVGQVTNDVVAIIGVPEPGALCMLLCVVASALRCVRRCKA